MQEEKKQKVAIEETYATTLSLRIKQSSTGYELFIFAVDGKTIAEQLGVRKMTWHTGKFSTEGFQRPLDLKRVKEIANYLSNNPVLPNALVVAFEPGSLSFTPLPNQVDPKCQFGMLQIKGKLARINDVLQPVSENERTGYVIDGQHRLRAIEQSTLGKGQFNVVISAFHGVPTKFQLEQFYALNQTVPISTGQLALLRREIGYELPPREAYRKAISDVFKILQSYPDSPFAPEKYVGSPPVYKGPLNISVGERMVELAIKSSSLRFKWHQDANQIPQVNLDYIARGLYVYWKAISELFSKYWGKKPKDQRLFCAIGIYAMMRFYDMVMMQLDITAAGAIEEVKTRFNPIKDIPWDKMQALPATVKTTFGPDHLFDAINTLWQVEGKRPYNLKIEDPATKKLLVDIELPPS